MPAVLPLSAISWSRRPVPVLLAHAHPDTVRVTGLLLTV